jgi:hypothetical protein
MYVAVVVRVWGRPVCHLVVVQWAKRAHPDLREDDQTVLRIARLVGVGALGVAVFFLVLIVRSLTS